MNQFDPTQKLPAFIILGAPGSGKGTQGKILGTVPRFFHFACGDVFRSLDTRTALGRQFVNYSRRGELVPDELTIDLWKSRIDNLASTCIYKPDIDFLVLDGIPRNMKQAALLDQHIEVLQVFHLTCQDRDELVRRMRKRALKENRMDDASDKVIDHRIATYDAETRPLLQYYPAEIITRIDATQPPVKVVGEIINRIIHLPVYGKMCSQIA